MSMRIMGRWDLPDLGSVYQVEDHGIELYGEKPLFQFQLAGQDKPNFELFDSMAHVLVSLVAAKYSGERGAGGTGVGTAADWFMQAIGANQLVVAEQPERVLIKALSMTAESRGPLYVRGQNMRDDLASRGYVIARMNS